MLTLFSRFFSRRWLPATLLVVFGVALCVRLGIWQLDRLEQRRAFNDRVLAQIDQPALALSGEALNADLVNMEYRQVNVTGRYDHSQEIALANQTYGNDWGVHLVTPLVIDGTDRAVLVDRGWIPGEVYRQGDWTQFHEQGEVSVSGVLRRPQAKADWGGRTDPPLAPGEPWRDSWNFVNIPEIDKQVGYTLLPAYVQQAPDPAHTSLPYRTQPHVEITEGSHQGYALQWFSFAAVLGLGYPFFVQRQEKRNPRPGAQGARTKTEMAPSRSLRGNQEKPEYK